MKKFFPTVFLLLFLITSVFSQELFTDVTKQKNLLNSSQNATVVKLKKNPFFNYHALVKIGDLKTLQKNGSVSFKLPNFPITLTANFTSVEYYSDNRYVWAGTISGDAGGVLLLHFDKGRVYGYIQVLDESYQLQSITNGISLLSKVDNLKVGQETCPDAPTGKHEPSSFRVDPCNIDPVRVLVVFTARARQAVNNINDIVNTSITQFNSAANGSLIPGQRARLILAGSQEVAFNETQNGNNQQLFQDVNNLSQNIPIQNLRNQTQADMVILLTNAGYTDARGIVQQIDATDPNCYGIVEVNASVANMTFAHEVGHLFGGRHEGDNLGSVGYDHGFRFNRTYNIFGVKRYATLMHRNPNGSNFSRVLRFSNPNATYEGVSTGDAQTANVARRIGETAPRIANYRTISTLSTSITGPNVINAYGTYNWECIVSCGNQPYTFAWSISTDGFNYGATLSTSDVLTLNLFPGNSNNQLRIIRLIVNSADGQSNTLFFTIANNTLPASLITNQLETITSNETLFPNPNNGLSTLRFKLETNSLVQVQLHDTQGRVLQNHNLGRLDSGAHEQEINLTNYPIGVYFCTITSNNKSSRFKILKSE